MIAWPLTGLAVSSAAATGGSSAAGHGNLISGGELRTFAFTVFRTTEGEVVGEAEVKNRALEVRAHIRIDCLRLVGGSRAILSGPITQSSNPGLIVPGRIGVFGVEDNGEGGAPVDRITTIPDYAPPKTCDEFTFVDSTLREIANPGDVVRTLNTILNGKIQVQL